MRLSFTFAVGTTVALAAACGARTELDMDVDGKGVGPSDAAAITAPDADLGCYDPVTLANALPGTGCVATQLECGSFLGTTYATAYPIVCGGLDVPQGNPPPLCQSATVNPGGGVYYCCPRCAP
jgi:hypothetical protein